jgi:hypothetical protein
VVVLATVLVPALSQRGSLIQLRALLDSGSQTSFITDAAYRQLELPRQKTDTRVVGIGVSKTSSVKGSGQLELVIGTDKAELLPVYALILQQITGLLPSKKIKIEDNSMVHLVELADERFNLPAEIDFAWGGRVP